MVCCDALLNGPMLSHESRADIVYVSNCVVGEPVTSVYEVVNRP
mgnify:CR=1 FL=1